MIDILFIFHLSSSFWYYADFFFFFFFFGGGAARKIADVYANLIYQKIDK